ncbi:MAG: ABC transporter permease [Kiritimatiellae bacterium]|nr:ABC transporter permease [Kiritimatiellia bacterium]HPC20537.1 ABC transporter permease [Kiritimatiellia bacterium]
MKPIDVQNQPVLPPRRVLQIALTGVKYRLFRSLVTVAVIVVAMAFLMNILTESLIKRAVAASVRDQIASLHRVDRWIARLSMARPYEEILARLAAEPPDPDDLRELARLGGCDDAAMIPLRRQAAEAHRILQFFATLDYGRRRVLVGPAEAVGIFDRLQDERAWAQFTAGLADMKTLRFPVSQEEFQAFLADWGVLRQQLDEIRQGQTAAIASIRSHLGQTPLVTALRNADGPFGDVLRAAGFMLSPEEASGLAVEVARLEHVLRIEGTINNPGVRQEVAALRDVLPGDVTMQMIWTLLRRQERAAWFLEIMRANHMDTGDLQAETLTGLARHQAHARLLAVAEQQTQDAGGGLLGIGMRMTWLALVSMLVCAVGIANAMLMSVTERFREIATLKCLGALDAFIMAMFLIEAALLGLAGGLGGAVAGFLLAGARMAVTFRTLLAQAFPWGDVAAAGAISIALGMVLAAVSAVYPSLRAARLAPMEAMRIE